MSSKKTNDPLIRQQILMKYNCKCAYCGDKLTINNLTIDHIQPLCRYLPYNQRGPDTVENYNPSCGSCNFSKSNRNLDEWKYIIQNKVESLLKTHPEFRTVIRLGLVKPVKKEFKFYFERINENGSKK